MTKIVDLIQRDLYTNDIIMQGTEAKSVIGSRVYARDPKIAGLLRNKDVGTLIEIPYVKAYEYVESQVMDESDDKINVDKIGKSKFKARVNFYSKAFGWKAMAATVSAGLKPIEVIPTFLGMHWSTDVKVRTFALLKGIERADTTLDASDKDMSYDTLIDALDLVGDSDLTKFSSLIVHSKVKNGLLKRDNNAYTKIESKNGIVKEYYNGLELLVDDRAASEVVNGTRVYKSTIVRNGGIVYEKANVGDKKELAAVSDELTGNGGGSEIIVSRMAYLLHPQGFDCVGTPANQTGMTIAEFETAANWNRIVPVKQTPTITIKTKG